MANPLKFTLHLQPHSSHAKDNSFGSVLVEQEERFQLSDVGDQWFKAFGKRYGECRVCFYSCFEGEECRINKSLVEVFANFQVVTYKVLVAANEQRQTTAPTNATLNDHKEFVIDLVQSEWCPLFRPDDPSMCTCVLCNKRLRSLLKTTGVNSKTPNYRFIWAHFATSHTTQWTAIRLST